MIRSVFNQKGGVGKTSITCNLASSFAHKKKKVLVLDLDPQANASQYLLGSSFNTSGKSIANFFSDLLTVKIFKDSLSEISCRSPFPYLSIIPSSRELGDLQQKLETRYKVNKLAQALRTLEEEEEFDEILIDTPPTLNFFSMSALIASDSVLVPFDCDAFSVKAIHQVMSIVDDVSEDHNPKLKVEGIVINQFQSQAKVPKELTESLSKQGFPILEPYLSHSVVMKESHEKSRPLVYMHPRHKLSLEFQKLADSLH